MTKMLSIRVYTGKEEDKYDIIVHKLVGSRLVPDDKIDVERASNELRAMVKDGEEAVRFIEEIELGDPVEDDDDLPGYGALLKDKKSNTKLPLVVTQPEEDRLVIAHPDYPDDLYFEIVLRNNQLHINYLDYEVSPAVRIEESVEDNVSMLLKDLKNKAV